MATTKDTPQAAQSAPQTAALVTVGATPLALPSDLLAALAEEAKEEAAKERPALSRISLKSGVMSYGGTPMANNEVEAIIIGASFRNTFYAGRYDPNNIKNPNCFALSLDDENMVPDDNVAEPEHPTCKGCPRDEWGSDPNGGRGKACKQSRRLVLIPANALVTDKGEPNTEGVKVAELAMMDLPVTSVKNYSQFVNTLAATANVPAWAAVCKIKVVPDAKTQFKVLFQAMRVVPTVELLDSIKTRRADATRIALEPYAETETKGGDEGATERASAPKKPAKF